MAVLEWFSKDVVAIIIIENKDVAVAGTGGQWELSSLVTVGLASSSGVGDDSGKGVVGTAFRLISGEEVFHHFGFKAWWNGAGRFGFGAALVLPGLVKVAFGSGYGVGWVLFESFGC